MARLNIEECWWTDPRRERLAKLLGGDPERADGVAIRVWRLGQEFWKHGRKLIPLHIFESLEHVPNIIQSNLVEVREDGVYVRGSCQYLDWTATEREKRSLAGKISAQKRREKYGSAQPKREHSRTPTEHTSNTLEPSVSVSSSVSKEKENIKKEKAPQPPEGELSPIRQKDFEECWLHYKNHFPNATRGGKPAEKRFYSNIKAAVDVEKLKKAIETYAAVLKRPENSWRSPKTTFSTFLGTQNGKDGEFWRDWIDFSVAVKPAVKAVWYS